MAIEQGYSLAFHVEIVDGIVTVVGCLEVFIWIITYVIITAKVLLSEIDTYMFRVIW